MVRVVNSTLGLGSESDSDSDSHSDFASNLTIGLNRGFAGSSELDSESGLYPDHASLSLSLGSGFVVVVVVVAAWAGRSSPLQLPCRRADLGCRTGQSLRSPKA